MSSRSLHVCTRKSSLHAQVLLCTGHAISSGLTPFVPLQTAMIRKPHTSVDILREPKMHSLTVGSHLLDDGSNEDTEHVETREGTHGLKPEASATTAKNGLPRQSPFEVAWERMTTHAT